MESVVFDGVIARVDAARACGDILVLYAQDIPDSQYASIRWSILGLPASNEIVVVAECGRERLGCSAPSRLIAPPMLERIYGIDVLDSQLASALSDALWDRYGEKLTAAAAKLSVGE